MTIEITDKAILAILDYKTKNNLQENQWLRCGVRGGKCSGFEYVLIMGVQKEFDIVIEKNNCKVLIDPKSYVFLEGMTLDYITGLEKGFKITNSKESKKCGCGNSVDFYK